MLNSLENSASLVWTWKGKTYAMPITVPDVLDWARAINEEGKPEEAVAWTLLQRTAWVRMQGKPISLSGLVQAYAQPINPAWFTNGPKHVQEMQRLERLGDIAAMRVEQRRAEMRPGFAYQSWNALRQSTRDLVGKILFGHLKSPVIGAVHYWASRGPDFAANQKAKPDMILLDRGYPYGKGWNVFFAVKGSENFGGISIINGQMAWPGGFMPSGPGGNMPPVVPILIGLAVGFAAWKWLL